MSVDQVGQKSRNQFLDAVLLAYFSSSEWKASVCTYTRELPSSRELRHCASAFKSLN